MSYPKVNTVHLHYKDQLLNAA